MDIRPTSAEFDHRAGGAAKPAVVGRDSRTDLRGPAGVTPRRVDLSTWQPRAACVGLPLEVFFPPEGERGRSLWRREEDAKRICRSCPVIDACRTHALVAMEEHGVWGATTPLERRHLIVAHSANRAGAGRFATSPAARGARQ